MPDHDRSTERRPGCAPARGARHGRAPRLPHVLDRGADRDDLRRPTGTHMHGGRLHAAPTSTLSRPLSGRRIRLCVSGP